MLNITNGYKHSPCMGCKKRYQNCHSECDEYKLWRRNYEAAQKLCKRMKESI